MIQGVICFLLYLAYRIVPTLRRPPRRLQGRPTITRVDGSTLACEDAVDRHARELVARGFRLEGTYAFSFGPPRAQTTQQAFAAGYLSPDGRVEAVILLTRTLSVPTPVSVVTCACTLRSFLDDGRIVFTTAARPPVSLFPRSTLHLTDVVRAPLEARLAEHERRVERSGGAARTLAAADFEAREERIHENTMQAWLAGGVVVPEGDGYRTTWRLGLRTYTRFVLLPFRRLQDVRRAVATCAIIFGGGLAAAAATAGLEPAAASLAASLTFATLTLASVLFLTEIAWGHACCIAALWYHAHGVTTGYPWVVALVTWAGVLPVVLRARRARQQALFHAAQPASAPTLE